MQYRRFSLKKLRHASRLLPEMRKDDYTVKEKPTLIEDMQGGPDCIVLKNLDTDSIRITGSVLSQSIASLLKVGLGQQWQIVLLVHVHYVALTLLWFVYLIWFF
ncbi:hypothetical protein LOK49_LG01G03792 [Camellia lanceoleosa]|uniref:Uncharacterized protein n=1 Tax=Camellia lanceoleosa TaxID=1840588 RepID=A0ACC0IYJ0_9ERIC|nr:hypothetical protein LOK49_LG01G03792 [Camellia lanceoleosa]